jgi:hypothetical protein
VALSFMRLLQLFAAARAVARIRLGWPCPARLAGLASMLLRLDPA